MTQKQERCKAAMKEIQYYRVPIKFKIGDIVYNCRDEHYKKYIVRIDTERGIYVCDGSSFYIIDQYNYLKVSSVDDLYIGDAVRIKGNPNCFHISEFLDEGKVRIHQVHGDDYDLIVNVSDLCDYNYHPFNIK